MRSLLLLTALLYAVVHANAQCTLTPPPPAVTYVYAKDMREEKEFVFKVRTCRDAYIALASSTEMQADNFGVPDDAFEVVLGGSSNTKTVIRDNTGGTTLVEYDGDHILDCINFKYFWIKVGARNLKVGMGSTIGEGEMARTPLTREINHMYVTGLIESTWEFDSCDN